jgi:transglutaminase-like putative cysteine protease
LGVGAHRLVRLVAADRLVHALFSGGGLNPFQTIQLFVQASLAYRYPRPAEVLLLIEAARTQTQTVRNEQLVLTPTASIARLDDSHTGDRRAVFSAFGDVEILYSALVDVRSDHADLSGAEAWPVRELPSDALSYLIPSRYCPSDRFEAFVEREFGAYVGGDKVLAMLAWLRARIEYRYGVSDVRSTAADTFIEGAGVCRDFSHLAITFCRAANIPARAVSAYAWRLDPPDLHAVAEVFLGGRWWLIDPTGRAPIEGMVRVASGRDAGDIAFMTVFGTAELIAQTFSVTRLEQPASAPA